MIFLCKRPCASYGECSEQRFLDRRRKERIDELASLVTRGGGDRLLTDGQRQLGGYLLARQVDGRPVEGGALDTLRNAHDTVLQTRQRLTARGNVDADVRFTQGQSTIETAAGREMERIIMAGRGRTEHERLVDEAASAMVARAGNCGDHANVATYLHASNLRTEEQVHRISSKDADHGWAELRSKKSDNLWNRLFKSGKNPGRDVVMDPWGKGPAVFAVDGEFSRRSTKSDLSFDEPAGANATEHMRALESYLGPSMHSTFEKKRAELQACDYQYPLGKIWSPTPVVARNFASRVKVKLEQANAQPLTAFHQEIHATQIARTLGANVDTATRSARRIVEVAEDLRGYPIASHPEQPDLDAAEIEAARQRRNRKATR